MFHARGPNGFANVKKENRKNAILANQYFEKGNTEREWVM